ncbi:MerR family transcriptional regulator [Pseudonocardia sp. GCM10023141]|uniref:MerR family transcriptional regulator n=1 Tax=Pseudonocardia sp. GCM10023141 TaxID=3252653 RepID=UPI00361D09DE
MAHTVGQVAALAGITVRTLHHYDAIGLLAPSQRSRGGHRAYADADLERLQQILFYRELGFGLDEITTLLNSDADPATHLRRQRDLLIERSRRLQDMAAAVEEALGAQLVGLAVSPAERFAVFGRWRPPTGYADAAQQRWGATPQWSQSRDRMASYTAADLQRMQDETDRWIDRLRAGMAAGTPPDAPAAVQLAEEHRLALDRWWFDCPPAMHVQLVGLAVTDPEQLAFLVRPERQLPGMAEYLQRAAMANAARLAADPAG